MTFKNKLGWFLITTAFLSNCWIALDNYLKAAKEHALEDCHWTYTENMWSHLSTIEEIHIGLIVTAVISAFICLVLWLIEKE